MATSVTSSPADISKALAQNVKVTPEAAVPEIQPSSQLAVAMRDGTKALHEIAQNSVFIQRFFKGDLKADEYGQYILSLYFIYSAMETLLEKYKDSPVIKSTHFPEELNRRESLIKDLEYFFGKERVPDLIRPSNQPPSVCEYVETMKKVCEINPALMAAYSYSRYMGGLSGGQILANRLKKHVLGLKENDASWDSLDGVAYYHFANVGNQVEFKNMYRDSLNAAPVDGATKDQIVKEAVRSFELNIRLIEEVQQLSEQGKLRPTILGGKEAKVATKPTSSISCNLVNAGSVVTALAVATAIYYRYSTK